MQQIQASWPKPGVYFGKQAYDPSPYDPETKHSSEPKKGFGSSKPPGRDDLSSTREVNQYRHALELEKKSSTSHHSTQELQQQLFQQSTSMQQHQQQASARTSGIPRHTFSSNFDRQMYVPEFSTSSRDPARKWERNYGPLRPTSADLGERCFDGLTAPAAGKRDFEAAFRTSAHPVVTGTLVSISQ